MKGDATKQLADACVFGSDLVSSHVRQIYLVDLPYQGNTLQAKAKEGFDAAGFRIQWALTRSSPCVCSGALRTTRSRKP
ncbi:hypothetical protein BH20ACT11_BH20ACT11_01280 [soil metagenome]